MACYTLVQMVDLDDNELNRKARKLLGLPETGQLSWSQAEAVRMEAGVQKAIAQVRKLSPTAIIRRKGNELTVTVQQG